MLATAWNGVAASATQNGVAALATQNGVAVLAVENGVAAGGLTGDLMASPEKWLMPSYPVVKNPLPPSPWMTAKRIFYEKNNHHCFSCVGNPLYGWLPSSPSSSRPSS